MFIGRERELKYLNDAYASKKAEFITLYGRRRVGKTETLTEFCKDKPNIFYACNECTDKKQFERFSNTLLSFFPELADSIRRFLDWEDLFGMLPQFAGDRKLVIVIDEFPYMVKNNKGIPSLLQNLWDHKLKNSNIMLIVSGSSISFMEDELLSSKNPLYGRMTGIYKLLPLPYTDAVKFFPDYSDENKLIAYSILGGIPHYLNQFDKDLSLRENVISHILSKGCALYGEVEYILHQELREPSAYNTILEAVAFGSSRFNEITERTLIENTNITNYLKNLVDLGILEKEFPVTASLKERTNKQQGEYKVADDFFRFWYAYAFPYSSMLEMGQGAKVYDNIIKNDLHRFASKSFENIAISYMHLLNAEDKLPFWFSDIGRWWGKVTHKSSDGKPYTVSEEIDVFATDKHDKYILGECKFTNEPIDLSVLNSLKEKLSLSGDVYYYLFSLSGFTDAVKTEAKTDHAVTLITAHNMLSV